VLMGTSMKLVHFIWTCDTLSLVEMVPESARCVYTSALERTAYEKD